MVGDFCLIPYISFSSLFYRITKLSMADYKKNKKKSHQKNKLKEGRVKRLFYASAALFLFILINIDHTLII